MLFCCECCVLSLRRANHSSRGVLPTVARRCVCVVKKSHLWGAITSIPCDLLNNEISSLEGTSSR
jgi:hypothetical protein